MPETSVLEIIQTVTGSCDFGRVEDYPGETEDEQRTNFWLEVINVKSSDSGFIHLVQSYLDRGWTEGSRVGWEEYPDDGDGYITEGHHRLVMAILLCLDYIPTSDFGSGDGLGISAHHNAWDDESSFLV